jgi:Flp pilus assembly protein TadD
MLKGTYRPKSADARDPIGSVIGTEDGATLWARQGSVCAEDGDLIGALHCFQRSLEANLDCFEAWSGLSDVFARMHDSERADACLEVARRLRGRYAREATA